MSLTKNGLTLLLLIITASSLGLADAYLSRTFNLVYRRFTWVDAQTYCRANYTDLATFRTQQEIIPFSQYSSWTWIGLYRDADNVWRWSGGDSVTFVNWYNQQPYFYQGGNCVLLVGNGEMYAQNCNSLSTFLCYKEHLILVNEEMTWEEALDYCRSHFTDLPSVLTSDDFSYAQNITQAAQTDQVWTGLRYLGSQWYWVHGDQMQTPNLPVCPAQGRLCGTLPKTGMTLGTENCEEKRNFLCFIN